MPRRMRTSAPTTTCSRWCSSPPRSSSQASAPSCSPCRLARRSSFSAASSSSARSCGWRRSRSRSRSSWPDTSPVTRRLSVLVVLTVAVLAAAWTFVGGAAAPVAPSGEWVGGYQVGSTRVVLHVTLGERGGRLVGSAATGIGARPVETALRAARFARGRLTLTLQDGTRLDGSVEGGAFRGIALANGNRGRFELLRERPAPDTALRPAVGAYRFAGGGVVALVTDPDAGGLRLVDYRNGALRRLSQLSRDRFVGGPGVSVPWPVRLTVEL